MPASKRGRTGGVGGAEYISLGGLRADGRLPSEVRRIRSSRGPLSRADGSAYYEQGNTRVLAAVFGPREPSSRGRARHDRAVVVTEVAGWPPRRAAAEAAETLRAVFEGAVLVRALPRTQIDIFVQVLQNDGGVVAAAINAASIALVDAGIPMRDLVVACSVGYVSEEFVLDLSQVEVGADGPELTMAVLAHSCKVVYFQMESRMPSVKIFEQALEHGTGACRQIFEVLNYEIKTHSLTLLDSRGKIAF